MARIVMTHDSAALVRGNASTKEETLWPPTRVSENLPPDWYLSVSNRDCQQESNLIASKVREEFHIL